MTITYVCIKASDLIALINRIKDAQGYVGEHQLRAGLERLDRTEVKDVTLFDKLDELFQSGKWPPMGPWPESEEYPPAKHVQGQVRPRITDKPWRCDGSG